MITVIDDYHLSIIEAAVARFLPADEVEPDADEAEGDEAQVETKVVRPRGRPRKIANEDAETK